ncbi:MAG: transcriptional regulator, partial [Cyanobacteriota bacterium]
MTADTALRLEQWLGVEAAFWLNLQNSYELDLAIDKSGETIKKTIQRRLSSYSAQAVELRQRGAFPAPDSATVTAASFLPADRAVELLRWRSDPPTPGPPPTPPPPPATPTPGGPRPPPPGPGRAGGRGGPWGGGSQRHLSSSTTMGAGRRASAVTVALSGA